MSKILDYAFAKTGFRVGQKSPFPEVVIGSAPGMPYALGWVYRTKVKFTLINGMAERAVETFLSIPLRSLESEVLACHEIATSWPVEWLEVRRSDKSKLSRVVALGANQEASILFEVDGISDASLAALKERVVGKPLREVVALIPTVDDLVS